MAICVTRKELVDTRMKILKEMNQYIINMGDENVWLTWIELGVPDEPTKEDYFSIADDEEDWKYTCGLFGRLIKD